MGKMSCESVTFTNIALYVWQLKPRKYDKIMSTSQEIVMKSPTSNCMYVCMYIKE